MYVAFVMCYYKITGPHSIESDASNTIASACNTKYSSFSWYTSKDRSITDGSLASTRLVWSISIPINNVIVYYDYNIFK